MHVLHGRARARACLAGLLLVFAAGVMWPAGAHAASSAGCEGGGFSLRLGDGSTLSGDQRVDRAGEPADRPAAGARPYVGWDIDAASFGVFDYAFTGAPNPLDITGGQRIVAFATKVPDIAGWS